MRTLILCGAVFLLAGLSLLTSQLIVEHIPDHSAPPRVAQTAAGKHSEMRRDYGENTTNRGTLLIVLPLLVVVCIQLWRNPP